MERREGGDWSRNGAPEFSAMLVAQNSAKRSITLDLKHARGKDIRKWCE